MRRRLAFPLHVLRHPVRWSRYACARTRSIVRWLRGKTPADP